MILEGNFVALLVGMGLGALFVVLLYFRFRKAIHDFQEILKKVGWRLKVEAWRKE